MSPCMRTVGPLRRESSTRCERPLDGAAGTRAEFVEFVEFELRTLTETTG